MLWHQRAKQGIEPSRKKSLSKILGMCRLTFDMTPVYKYSGVTGYKVRLDSGKLKETSIASLAKQAPYDRAQRGPWKVFRASRLASLHTHEQSQKGECKNRFSIFVYMIRESMALWRYALLFCT